MIQILEDDLSGADVQALLALHHAVMHADSPPGQAFALDLEGLSAADITVWSARRDGALAGIGALRDLGGGAGEVKSMRTHPDHLRVGVAAAVLETIIEDARARGMVRLSLETGRGSGFEPALALYRRRGFIEGAPFGTYRASDFNQFLHLDL